MSDPVLHEIEALLLLFFFGLSGQGICVANGFVGPVVLFGDCLVLIPGHD